MHWKLDSRYVRYILVHVKQKHLSKKMTILQFHPPQYTLCCTPNFAFARTEKKINAFFTRALRSVGNLNIKTSGLIKLNLGRKSIWRKLLLIKEKTIIKRAQETCTRKASYTIVVYKITVTRVFIIHYFYRFLLTQDWLSVEGLIITRKASRIYRALRNRFSLILPMSWMVLAATV